MNPDLLLLDIQMPKLTGFEVFELLDPCPAVIFTTAYEQDALDAFEVHAVDDVDFVEARDDRVCIQAPGVEYDKTEKLGRLEKNLDPTRFVRIHRSYILNLDRLARVELYAKDSRLAILHDGRKLPVSRSGYVRLKALL